MDRRIRHDNGGNFIFKTENWFLCCDARNWTHSLLYQSYKQMFLFFEKVHLFADLGHSPQLQALLQSFVSVQVLGLAGSEKRLFKRSKLSFL